MPLENIDPRYRPFLFDYVRIQQYQWAVGEKIAGRLIAECFGVERSARLVELQSQVEAAGLSWALLEEYASININDAANAA